MKIDAAADTVVQWLHKIRREGRRCPTNIVQSCMMLLDCSVATARDIKDHLVTSGRVEINHMHNRYRVDGLAFAEQSDAATEAEFVKDLLRQRYAPVYDLRTARHPKQVAAGAPEWLVVGTELLRWEDALAYARRIARKEMAHAT